jgi:formylglycine-generating enzyme required for sulfatase activity
MNDLLMFIAISKNPGIAAVAVLSLASMLAIGQSSVPVDSLVGVKAGAGTNVLGIELCWCPPGKFRMGSPTEDPGRRADEFQVEVTLTRGFWMGKYEITQGQWRGVMGEPAGPLNAGVGENYPVYW